MVFEGAEAQSYWRHQVVELPQVKAAVTEYRLYTTKCPGCGKKTEAKLPAGVPNRPFGPRLQATAAVLTGRYRLSRREAKGLLWDIFSVKLSLGALSSLEEDTSCALETVVEEVGEAVRQTDAVNMDETGWKEEGSRAWLWTGVTPKLSLFKIAPTRSGAVVEAILGQDYGGVVGTDRYSAYSRIPLAQRAICWAHIKRNFQALVELGGEAQCVGLLGLEEVKRVFRLWHKYQDGKIDRQGLRRRVRRLKRLFREVLDYGKWCGDEKAQALCWSLSDLGEALWTFAEVEGVEPTNNAAERALRPGVLWRKGSFGTQSDRGSRFAERMLTVAASCRLQGRHLLSFLEQVCRAAMLGTSMPSLVGPSHAPG
jgi:transposase